MQHRIFYLNGSRLFPEHRKARLTLRKIGNLDTDERSLEAFRRDFDNHSGLLETSAINLEASGRYLDGDKRDSATSARNSARHKRHSVARARYLEASARDLDDHPQPGACSPREIFLSLVCNLPFIYKLAYFFCLKGQHNLARGNARG